MIVKRDSLGRIVKGGKAGATGGRPSKRSDAILDKLEYAWCLDCTDHEAALFAGISYATLKNWLKADSTLVERRDALKHTPVLQARQSVIRGLKDSPELALKYLERKAKAEFSLRQELTDTEGNAFRVVVPGLLGVTVHEPDRDFTALPSQKTENKALKEQVHPSAYDEGTDTPGFSEE